VSKFDPLEHKRLRPFVDHGVVFDGLRDDEAFADSPFDPSGSTDKLHVNVKTGAWHDKKTGDGGGLPEFLIAMQAIYREALTPDRLGALAKDRKLPVAAFEPWPVGWDDSRDAYTLLVTDADGRACDIRRYALAAHQWLSTAGCHVGLLGIDQLNSRPGESVGICEGEFDGIAFAFLLKRAKQPGVVLAVPGAGTFKESWACAALADRDVAVLYDHDDAGKNGDAVVAKRLRQHVRSLKFLHWPDGRRDGWDVRDEVVRALKQNKPKACVKRLRAWLSERPRIEPKGDKTTAGSSIALDGLKAEWVYAYETKRFVFIGQDEARAFYELDKESFSDRYAVEFPGGGQRTAANQMLIGACTQVARPAYLPGQPQLTTEHVKGAELPVVNLWIPSPLVIEAGDATPYLDHVAYVIPETKARQVALDWLAFLLREPQRKPNWAVFLGGEQGIGKDTLVWPVTQALGPTNFCTPTPDDLESGYTDWLRHIKLGIVDTLRFHGKRHLMDRMKPWIASPPERLRINGKYAVQYDIANLVAFFFMANREDALALDPDDRRFYVYWSVAKKKPGRYYRELWTWLRAHAGVVAHYLLHEHQMSERFDPLAPPPMTDAKRHMIRANEPPLTQLLRQALEEGSPPLARELVTIDDIQRHLLAHTSLRDQTPHAIGRALKDLGAQKLDVELRLDDKDGRGRIHVRRRHPWALQNVAHYRDMNERALTAEYKRQCAAGSYRSAAATVVLMRGGRS
jgi:hypothetical protein